MGGQLYFHITVSKGIVLCTLGKLTLGYPRRPVHLIPSHRNPANLTPRSCRLRIPKVGRLRRTL